MCCMLGLTINHSTFICTRYNDPLTTSVAGSVKNIIMTCIGAVSFGDFIYAKWNVVGLGVSMAGAVWYATRAAMKVCITAITCVDSCLPNLSAQSECGYAPRTCIIR